jgi:hypothetical protein
MEEKIDARQCSTFKIPVSLQTNGVMEIGVRELTTEEEKMAVRRVGGDSYAIAYELPKQSLCEVNGKRVSLADGTADKAWDTFNPQQRQLVLRAYAAVNNAKDEEVDDFLKSRVIKVG